MKKRSVFGWVELLLGVLLVLLGIYTLRNPATALTGVVVGYGIAALLSGVADIVLYGRIDRRTGFGPISALLSGIVGILLGVLLLTNLSAGVLSLSLLFPIWFIVRCFGRLTNLGFVRLIAGNRHYWLSLIVNVVGLVLGIILLANPYASAVSAAYVITVWLLLLGVGSILLAVSRLGGPKDRQSSH